MEVMGFPLDSRVEGIGSDGLPIYSNEYKSSDLRSIFRCIMSDGIIASSGQAADGIPPFHCELEYKNNGIVGGGVSHEHERDVIVSLGTMVISGAFITNDDPMLKIGIQAPPISNGQSSATKWEYVIVRLRPSSYSAPYEAAEIITKTGTSQTMNPSEVMGYNEKCIAAVKCTTFNNGSMYSYSFELTDLRDSEFCGYSAPFADVDLSHVHEAMNKLDVATNRALQVAASAVDGIIGEKIVGANNLADKSVTQAKIADAAVGETQLAQSVRDSLSRIPSSSATKALPFNVQAAATASISRDANNLISPGIYSVLKSAVSPNAIANLPSDANQYGSMLVLAYDESYRCMQLLFGTADGSSSISVWVRGSYYLNGSRAWTSWRSLDQSLAS